MNKLMKAGLASTLLVMTSLPTIAKDYSSAEIYTADTWLYGKYVFRMQAAEGSGILSNFFLWKPESETSAVDWEEVDFEVFGKNGANSWQSNLITTGNGWQTSEEVHTIASSFADEYHTFSLEWTPTYISWSVDGQEVRRTSGGQADLIKNPASIRFNFWASTSTGWVGNFDDSILPVHMYVNWLEYYSWNGETFDLDWRDDFDTFNTNRWSEAAWTFDGNYVDFVPENSTVSDGYLVLSLTKTGEEGFTGTVPLDLADPDPVDPVDPDPVDPVDPDPVDPVDPDPVDPVDPDPVDPVDPDPVDPIIPETGVSCSYKISNQWNTGFVAEISLTNNGTSTVNGWSVNWQYSDGSAVTQLWNAIISGSSTYNATNLSWNSSIAPGQTVTFGFQGNKGSGNGEIPVVTGDICE